MQQDEQTTEQQPTEIPSETEPAVPQPNGKKGGKAACEKPAQAQGGEQIAALKTQLAQAHTKLDRLKTQIESLGSALIGAERALEDPIHKTAKDQEALRKAFIGFVDQYADDKKKRADADARMFDAVNKLTTFTAKSCEAAAAACEALTGMRPADARIVRQLIRELREAKDGKGQAAAPTPPPQASRSPFWTPVKTAIACGTGFAVALGWLLLS